MIPCHWPSHPCQSITCCVCCGCVPVPMTPGWPSQHGQATGSDAANIPRVGRGHHFTYPCRIHPWLALDWLTTSALVVRWSQGWDLYSLECVLGAELPRWGGFLLVILERAGQSNRYWLHKEELPSWFPIRWLRRTVQSGTVQPIPVGGYFRRVWSQVGIAYMYTEVWGEMGGRVGRGVVLCVCACVHVYDTLRLTKTSCYRRVGILISLEIIFSWCYHLQHKQRRFCTKRYEEYHHHISFQKCNGHLCSVKFAYLFTLSLVINAIRSIIKYF